MRIFQFMQSMIVNVNNFSACQCSISHTDLSFSINHRSFSAVLLSFVGKFRHVLSTLCCNVKLNANEECLVITATLISFSYVGLSILMFDRKERYLKPVTIWSSINSFTFLYFFWNKYFQNNYNYQKLLIGWNFHIFPLLILGEV